MDTFLQELGIFEVWKAYRKPGSHSITDKFPYILKYRGRVIDFGQSLNEWERCVSKNPLWLQQKVAEIDFYLETPAGKRDIEEGKAYQK